MTTFAIMTVLSLAAWTVLALFWGGFWRADQRLPNKPQSRRKTWPGVVAVVPARDEAATIADVAKALTQQDYPGDFQVIVVDDNSTDGTGALAGSVDGVQVIVGQPLEAGWSGKLWAQSQGIAQARAHMPDGRYLLLTDADILHDPLSVKRLVLKAEIDHLDLVSEMVELRSVSHWEKMLIPAFVFFFQKLYPFPWVNDTATALAGAAGGCMLVRCQALEEAGGTKAIKQAVIDDCALAKLLKDNGGQIWLGLSGRVRSLRAYDGLGDVWDMVARTAFIQLKCSPLMLLGTIIGMGLLYLLPPLAVLVGLIATDGLVFAAGFATWALMAALYSPTLGVYGQSFWRGFALPLAGLLYTAMTISSAIRHWQGAGARWKGRSYG